MMKAMYLPFDQTGESLQVRGPQVMEGYWKRSEATKEILPMMAGYQPVILYGLMKKALCILLIVKKT